MMFSSDPELESFSKILGAKNLTHSCSHRFTAGSGKEHLNCVQKAALRAGQRSDVLIKQMLILSGVKGTGTGRRFWGREKKKKKSVSAVCRAAVIRGWRQGAATWLFLLLSLGRFGAGQPRGSSWSKCDGRR